MKFKILLAIFSLIWMSLVVRVYHLAIQSNEHYETLAQNNSIKT